MNNNQKRYKRQKRNMLDKVRVLFWEKGYDKTSMKDIASACGFEPGNIYNYFHNKEALLYEVMREDMDKLVSSVKHLRDDKSSSPTEQLRSFLHNTASCLLGPRSTSRLLADTGLRSLTRAHRRAIIKLRDDYELVLRTIIRSGIDNGEFANVDEALAGYFIVSMLLRTRMWFSPQGRLTSAEVADAWSNFALNGLRRVG